VPTALIVGASRGLGLAIARELAARGWDVIGTVRGDAWPEGMTVEQLDMTVPAQIAALRERLAGRTIDLLFVNAGIATEEPFARIEAVGSEEFGDVLLTNAWAPMRVIAALHDLVPAEGLIGAMSSGQGSIAGNETGGNDVYRASKTALNMLMRSFAVRPDQAGRAFLLLAPGWIQTDMGGDRAPYTVEDSAPILTDLLLGARGTPGLRYLDRFGRDVAW